jgi:hypothetical protein
MRRCLIPAAVAGLILALLAIYPQIRLQNERGEEFNGAFASCDLDEMAYASYLQAVIDGRPRRNDPYTGRDNSSDSPQPESLFSIQFVTAYMAAGIAGVIGFNGWEMMPLISILSAFFTALAAYWLIFAMVKNHWWALAGTLSVIVFAAAVSGIGAISVLLERGSAYPFFPYLRRHIPSLSFPFLFAFLAAVWSGLGSEGRKQIAYGVIAAISFWVLVFSYFYLWTGAAAVLAALFAITLVYKDERRRADLRFIAMTGALSGAALLPYAYLLSGRNPMMDKAQLLVHTREPDLFRNIEIIGTVLLTAIGLLIWKKKEILGRRGAIFLAALATSPIVVFNQQVLTGRSLQPFHYEYYSVNYVLLAGVVIAACGAMAHLLKERRMISAVLAVVLAAFAAFWGGYEAYHTTKMWDRINAVRDEAMPVNLRLRELAGDIDEGKRLMTLNLEPLQADSQPTVAPQGVVWARHQHTFAGIKDWEENRRRYFQLLYYSDREPEWLRRALTGCSNIEACMALFGWDRFNPTLSAAARPLTMEEVEEVVEEFAAFTEGFGRELASTPKVDFVVVRRDAGDELVNLDKWYERDEGETLGEYVFYRVRPTY